MMASTTDCQLAEWSLSHDSSHSSSPSVTTIAHGVGPNTHFPRVAMISFAVYFLYGD